MHRSKSLSPGPKRLITFAAVLGVIALGIAPAFPAADLTMTPPRGMARSDVPCYPEPDGIEGPNGR